jgi:hypothetical protein
LRKIENEKADKLLRSAEKSKRGRSIAERAEGMHHPLSEYLMDRYRACLWDVVCTVYGS